MHDHEQHSANVQIGEDHLSRSDDPGDDATARNLYPTRRGWHLGGGDALRGRPCVLRGHQTDPSRSRRFV